MNKGTIVFVSICLFLLGMVGLVSVISQDSPIPLTTEEIEDEYFDEIQTYLQIKDKIGKYYGEYPDKQISKIAILVTPLVSQEVNLSGLSIKLNDGEMITYIDYSGNSTELGSHTLFEHPLWANLNNTYGLLVINDEDDSMKDYDIFNRNSDMAYIVFELSGSFKMSRDEEMYVTLFPSTGWERTIWLEAPIPINSIAQF